MEASRPIEWTRTARLLHWGMALAVLIEVPAGFAMAWTYGSKVLETQAIHLRASQTHHTLGMLMLLAVLFRLFWRWKHGAATLPAGIVAWQRLAARGTQAGLYLLLLLIPLSGWAALSALGAGGGYPAPEMWFFTHDGFGPGGMIPHLVEPHPWNAKVLLGYGLFARAHVYMLMFGGGLVAIHGLAGLYHHFIRRDGVLRQMWSGTTITGSME
ncbi:cytochrome b/b6 domain-containing protein [Novosphingobium sp.]|uniref:cytochrome b n=1 Tax=Novosphingobium sp. TaxID=1874826 RepID=UPI00286EA422|nr:cytochrome b/b6 domain-containing protein [Novosphingobium sp.]